MIACFQLSFRNDISNRDGYCYTAKTDFGYICICLVVVHSHFGDDSSGSPLYAEFLWKDLSKPSSISFWSGKSREKRPMTLTSKKPTIKAYRAAPVAAASCLPNCSTLASMPFTSGSAKMPMQTVPRKPPIPCTPHTSSASSRPRRFASLMQP